MFIWTLSDVIGAVVLGGFAIWLLVLLLCIWLGNVRDWIKAKFKGPRA